MIMKIINYYYNVVLLHEIKANKMIVIKYKLDDFI